MALQEAFPEHKWEPWRFKKMQKNYRFSAPSLRDFFDSLKAVYDIHEMSDWYKITHEQIAHQGGSSISIYHKEPLKHCPHLQDGQYLLNSNTTPTRHLLQLIQSILSCLGNSSKYLKTFGEIQRMYGSLCSG